MLFDARSIWLRRFITCFSAKHFWATSNPCTGVSCSLPLKCVALQYLFILLLDHYMSYLFYGIAIFCNALGDCFQTSSTLHILLVNTALPWRTTQRAESFMKTQLESNFKSFPKSLVHVSPGQYFFENSVNSFIHCWSSKTGQEISLLFFLSIKCAEWSS